MPKAKIYKCITCNKVMYGEPSTCDDELANCYVVKAPTIHFLSSKGTGQIRGTRQQVGKQTSKSIETEIVATTLRVACSCTSRSEQATFLKSLVTCKECIDFINTIEVATPVPPPSPTPENTQDYVPENKQSSGQETQIEPADTST